MAKRDRFRDDPDETEGRRIYRYHADRIANFQMQMQRRRPRIKREPDMSLYNLVFGKNPFSTLLLEILGTTEDQVPRFRDCYLDEEGRIVIHTRTGGGNRMFHEHPDLCKKEFPAMFEDPEEAPSGPWNSDLRKLPGFMYDRDDGFDTTYADFVYEVPEAFKSQVELLSNFGAVSNPAERWQSLLDDLKKGDTDSEEAKRALKVGERLMAQINEALNQNT